MPADSLEAQLFAANQRIEWLTEKLKKAQVLLTSFYNSNVLDHELGPYLDHVQLGDACTKLEASGLRQLAIPRGTPLMHEVVEVSETALAKKQAVIASFLLRSEGDEPKFLALGLLSASLEAQEASALDVIELLTLHGYQSSYTGER